MNTADVAYALNLDLDAINKRLHDPAGPHMQDIETLLYALHSLQYAADPPATNVLDGVGDDEYNPGQDDDTTRAIHDDHLRHRTPA